MLTAFLTFGRDSGTAAGKRAARSGFLNWSSLDHADSPVAAVCESARVDEEVIPILRVADAAAAVAWYRRLGFTKEWEHHFAPGLPAFVSVARGRVRLFLSEHHGDARPDTLIYLRVGDVDAIAAEFGVAVEEQPWARELELRDPDGNRLRIGRPSS
jgi:catechol 2,3-dioxygenase-like lactoylglutathione lyase family enzyme